MVNSGPEAGDPLKYGQKVRGDLTLCPSAYVVHFTPSHVISVLLTAHFSSQQKSHQDPNSRL